MIVSYNFDCSWDVHKKDRISRLLLERIFLLAGDTLMGKIVHINFCDKDKVCIREQLTGSEFLLFDENYAVVHFGESSNLKTYNLVLEKKILLSMLIPGAGQSFFDNLILDIKNAI